VIIARILMHICFHSPLQRRPELNCKCQKYAGLWLRPEVAIDYVNNGTARIIGERTIALCGRLPYYKWPRMTTPQVIFGCAAGNKRDLAFVEELGKTRIRANPVRIEHHRIKTRWGTKDIEMRVQVGVSGESLLALHGRSILSPP